MCFSTARLVRTSDDGDRRVALALRELGEHLPLTWRQGRQWRLGAETARPHEHLDDLGIDHRPAVDHRFDRGDQVRWLAHPLLEQVRPSRAPGVQQCQRVIGIGELAEDDDADRRMTGAERLGHLDALIGVGRRHPDIGQDRIGFLLFDRRKERVGVNAESTT